MESLPENLENLLQQVLDQQEAGAITTESNTATDTNTNADSTNEETSSELPNTTPSPNSGTIPEISKTYFMNDAVSRFQGASWYDEVLKLNVLLIGCGGIGSWTALLLARLNIAELTLFDNDTVELNNLSGQLFRTQGNAHYKVNEVYNTCREFSCTRTRISAINSRFTSHIPSPITICGLDNMESRLAIFNRWAERYSNSPTALFIDGRLSAEAFQIFAIQGGNTNSISEYRKKWLFPDSEGDPTVCSYKQTSFMASMIASFITNILVNFADNLQNTKNLLERTVPFYTEYSGDYMFLKNEIL